VVVMRALVFVLLCFAGCARTAYTLRGKVNVPATLTAWELWDDRVLATVRSDDDGAFAIDIPAERREPNAPVWLYVRAPGHATTLADVGLADAPVAIRLRKGKVVTGRVRTPSGTPVRGARVVYETLRHHYEGPPLEMAHTDEAGRFQLSGIDPTRAHLIVIHPAFDWGWVDARAKSDLDIVLQPLREVRGRILAGGRPVRGACLHEFSDTPFFVTGVDGRYRAWCDSDNSADREYDFRVVAPGFRIEECIFDGEDITLDPCAPFEGVVVAPGGSPVDKAVVVLRSMLVEQRCETGTDGRFRFDAVPRIGPLYDKKISVERLGFVPFDEEITDLPKHMVVRLARGARLTGRVMRDGKPVPGAGVSAVGDRWLAMKMLTGRDVMRNAYTDENGRFTMHVVPIEADGVFAWWVDDSDDTKYRIYRSLTRLASLKKRETYDLGDLELRDRLPLRGGVKDHRGRPVAGLKMICRPLGMDTNGLREQTARTDMEGRFEFPDLAVREWNLLAGPKQDWLVADCVYPGDILEYQLEDPHDD